MRRLLPLVFSLLGVACVGEQVNDVQLVLDPVGFTCREQLDDDTSRYLLLRAYEPPTATGEFNLVVDYLAFASLPSCRPNRVIDYCRDHGCPIVRRDCLSLDAAALASNIEGMELDEETAAMAITQALADQPPITRDAPDGVVTVRVVATAESCDSVMRGADPVPLYRCASLLGCGYSCPGQLDEISGGVDIAFDSLGIECTAREVEICAGLGHDGYRLGDSASWCAR